MGQAGLVAYSMASKGHSDVERKGEKNLPSAGLIRRKEPGSRLVYHAASKHLHEGERKKKIDAE